jgi:CRISPR-associated protein Cmr2
MARKPLEIWAASYLFSYLMDCIIQSIPESSLISPAKLKETTNDYGLYPDRVYMRGEINADSVLDTALNDFKAKTKLPIDYFNRMSVKVENITDDKTAIKTLNNKLDALELYSNPAGNASYKVVRDFLINEGEVFGIDHSNYRDLETIAKAGRDVTFSYDKYICVVQADGDGVGQVVSNISTDDLSKTISPALLQFGKDAVGEIKKFGGFPIYAGGDDLLFIAPVVGKSGDNIFKLITQIDKKFKPVQTAAETLNNDFKTSMSYGVSISYYKFPLYEALKTAVSLLFDTAKSIDGKNAIAWKLQKHSGSTVEGQLSKADETMYSLFEQLIAKSNVDEGLLSSIAFKIKANKAVLDTFFSNKNWLSARIGSFYENFIDNTDDYANCTQQILATLLEHEMNKTKKDVTQVVTQLYGMLRTAKFINGENIKEEEEN